MTTVAVLLVVLRGIAETPKQGEREEEGSEHLQVWDDEGGQYAIDRLHSVIDEARAALVEAGGPDFDLLLAPPPEDDESGQ